MNVLAIDPGYEQSAWVAFDGTRVIAHAIEANPIVLRRFVDDGQAFTVDADGARVHIQAAVLEQIESFGMAVGREIFETVFWTGRFYEAAILMAERMTRKDVKSHLCHSTRATESNIRVALIDRFGGTERAVGKKKTPGPLYGIKSHEWSALAIAVTWWDLRVEKREATA